MELCSGSRGQHRRFVAPGTDASRCFRQSLGEFLKQVTTAEHAGGVEVGKMSHQPLGFLSENFCGSQQRWTTVDKEGSPS